MYPPVAERVGVHAGSSVKRSTHAAADIPISRTGTRPGNGHSGSETTKLVVNRSVLYQRVP
jgi:hypothetical protein